MFAANNPSLDISKAFDGYGARGGLLASRAIFIFAIAVFVGLVHRPGAAGRHRRRAPGDDRPVGRDDRPPADPGQRGGRDPARPVPGSGMTAGRHVHRSEVRPAGRHARRLRVLQRRAIRTTRRATRCYPQVTLVIPGERYRFVETREAVVLSAGQLVALLLAGFVVVAAAPGLTPVRTGPASAAGPRR